MKERDYFHSSTCASTFPSMIAEEADVFFLVYVFDTLVKDLVAVDALVYFWVGPLFKSFGRYVFLCVCQWWWFLDERIGVPQVAGHNGYMYMKKQRNTFRGVQGVWYVGGIMWVQGTRRR